MTEDSAADGRKTCPYCGEAITGLPRNCPECDEDLSGMLAGELSAVLVKDTREDVAEGRFDPGRAPEFRRFRTGTIVFASLLAASLLGIAVAWGRTNNLMALAILSWVTAVICVVPTLVLGIQDLQLRKPEELRSAEAAFRTYVKCVREKRWAYALSLVLPRGREGERRRPAIEALRLEAESLDVDTPKGLAAFWSPLLFTGNSTVRTAQAGPIRVQGTGPDTASGVSAFKVTAYPTWVSLLVLLSLWPAIIAYFILRKTAEIPLDMALMEVKGRWYVVDAVPVIPSRQEEN